MKIYNIYGTEIWSDDLPTLKESLAAALKAKADLSGSNLSYSDLSGSDLSGSNLSYSNLSYSDLSGSNLIGSNLIGSNLSYSNLSGSNLIGSNLIGSNLSYSDLIGSNLSYSDLSGSNLSYSDLSGSNLIGSNLIGSNLSYSNLRGAKNAQLAIARTRILPEGDLMGWKKCSHGVIAKLLIPATAKRSHAFGRKCRAECVKVMEVIGADVGVSLYNCRTEYRAGEEVRCDKWEEDWTQECAGGIHFFITREEAEAHV